ncbi:MAG: TetR/AcrR family transcriptional regulator [Rhizobiaceae bacterium]
MGGAAAEVIEPEIPAGSRIAAILDAAEIVFARSGFAGASVREIAERAGVAQALIHYHFKTKENLFEAMTARRSGEINNARAAMLDELLVNPDTVELEHVVEALFRPTIEVGHSLAEDGGGFSRILVSVANSSDERDKRLAEIYYDPIAHKFIDALCRIEPGLTRKDAVWAYMFSIGVGMTMMARTGRSTRLSAGECDDSDIEDMLSEIVIYVCGGIRALIGNQERNIQ